MSLGYYAFKGKTMSYEEFRKKMNELADKLSKLVGKKVVVNEAVLPYIYEIYRDFGLPYCICAKRWTNQMVCPCVLAVSMIKYYRECWCGLFFIAEEEEEEIVGNENVKQVM